MDNVVAQNENIELSTLHDQARSCLKNNQVDSAIRIFAKILKSEPDDVESLLFLGDGYLIAGEHNSAMFLYRQAKKVSPEQKDIEQRIKMLLSMQVEFLEVLDDNPMDYISIDKLIKKLTGTENKITDTEVQRAETLLNEFMKSESPAESVSTHIGEINALIPAFIELNVRQAKEEGKMDLVESLKALLTELLIQQGLENSIDTPKKSKTAVVRKRRVLLAGFDSNESFFRLHNFKQTLANGDFELVLKNKTSQAEEEDIDLLIARNPHSSSSLVKKIASCALENIPVIMDLDTDFSLLPENHPDFEKLGLKNQKVRRSYHALLELANSICAPSETFVDKLKNQGFNVTYLPETWNSEDKLWLKPSPERKTFNLGLVVMPGQLEDVAMIRRMIIRILREFGFTRLVIYGDLGVYQLFDGIHDDRKLFLPPAGREDYPYIFSQMDILLSPLQNTSFNQLKSDRRLLEAGIRNIPWVASPIKSYTKWGKGGLLAETQESWYSQIKRIILDPTLKSMLGEKGHQLALSREIDRFQQTLNLLVNETFKKKH